MNDRPIDNPSLMFCRDCAVVFIKPFVQDTTHRFPISVYTYIHTQEISTHV